jgi:LytR cell envelope-related transcriptional attenuator
MSEPSRPQHESHTSGSHYQPGLGVVLLILVLFVGAAMLMLRSPGVASSGATTTTTTTVASTQTTIPKTRVRVQVANGTQVTGLARNYTQRLVTLGWNALPEVNGPATTVTVIYYRGGFSWAAREVAQEIKVKASAVKPLRNPKVVAGASGDDVIIVLGRDLGTTS